MTVDVLALRQVALTHLESGDKAGAWAALEAHRAQLGKDAELAWLWLDLLSQTPGRATLLASLQRAAILTSEKFKGVRVNIEPGTLRIASSNAEQEEAKEEIEIDYGGDTIEVGFNVTYLMDALSNISQDMVKIELQDGNASALITVPEQSGFKYVVMPMRI